MPRCVGTNVTNGFRCGNSVGSKGRDGYCYRHLDQVPGGRPSVPRHRCSFNQCEQWLTGDISFCWKHNTTQQRTQSQPQPPVGGGGGFVNVVAPQPTYMSEAPPPPVDRVTRVEHKIDAMLASIQDLTRAVAHLVVKLTPADEHV